MGDLEQYEVNALRHENFVDACEGQGHRHPHYTKTYDDGAKAIMCSNCETCVEFIDAVEA